jgi:hypothetical protein
MGNKLRASSVLWVSRAIFCDKELARFRGFRIDALLRNARRIRALEETSGRQHRDGSNKRRELRRLHRPKGPTAKNVITWEVTNQRGSDNTERIARREFRVYDRDAGTARLPASTACRQNAERHRSVGRNVDRYIRHFSDTSLERRHDECAAGIER